MNIESSSRSALIADDDEKFGQMLASALQEVGFTVTTAIDGEQALDLARSKKPDVILLDIMMPKMIGFEVLEEVKNDSKLKNIPVFTLSHLAQPSDVDKAKRLGAVHHFVKTNFSIGDLVKKVQAAIQLS